MMAATATAGWTRPVQASATTWPAVRVAPRARVRHVPVGLLHSARDLLWVTGPTEILSAEPPPLSGRAAGQSRCRGRPGLGLRIPENHAARHRSGSRW